MNSRRTHLKDPSGREFLLMKTILQGWDELIDEAICQAQKDGFDGRYLRTIAEFQFNYHGLAIIECEFERGDLGTYIVVVDSHIGGAPARLHRFTEAVHFLQNTTEQNFWQTVERDPAEKT